MLRSLDYAAHSVVLSTGGEDTTYAEDWARLNRAVFLRGYGHDGAEPAHTSHGALVLLRGYEVDKSVYESQYRLSNTSCDTST